MFSLSRVESNNLLKYQDPTTEDYSDIEIERVHDSYLHRNNNKLKADGPFSHTDIVIFNDAYKGLLPLNGITFSKYEKVKCLFNKIISDKTNIRVEGTTEFKKKIFDNIAIALSRKQGRKLLSDVVKVRNVLTIVEGKVSLCASRHGASGKIILNADLNDDIRFLFYDMRHSEKFAKSEIFIDLLHEILHFQHEQEHEGAYFDFPGVQLVSSDLDNTEEQVTITGLLSKVDTQQYFREQDVEPSVTVTKHEDSSSVFNQTVKYLMGIYNTIIGSPTDDGLPSGFEETKDSSNDRTLLANSKLIYPISENSLRASFSLPIRINHRGVKAKTRYSLADFIISDASKLLSARLSEDMSRVDKVFKKRNNSNPLTLAASKDSRKSIKTLLANGANINGQDGNGQTALSVAISNDNYSLAVFLLEQDADPLALLKNGQTPFGYLFIQLIDHIIKGLKIESSLYEEEDHKKKLTELMSLFESCVKKYKVDLDAFRHLGKSCKEYMQQECSRLEYWKVFDTINEVVNVQHWEPKEEKPVSRVIMSIKK